MDFLVSQVDRMGRFGAELKAKFGQTKISKTFCSIFISSLCDRALTARYCGRVAASIGSEPLLLAIGQGSSNMTRRCTRRTRVRINSGS
jgi:hypothetical protein